MPKNRSTPEEALKEILSVLGGPEGRMTALAFFAIVEDAAQGEVPNEDALELVLENCSDLIMAMTAAFTLHMVIEGAKLDAEEAA